MASGQLNPNTQATLLLTSHLRQSAQTAVAPLQPREFWQLLTALKTLDLQPADLFESENLSQLRDKQLPKLPDTERVGSLLARGMALAFAVDSWSDQGIWVVGWDDNSYPSKYRQRLGHQSPPILYGIGDQKLLAKSGIAVVGSRDVDEPGMTFTRKVAEALANEDVQVISGAARGVDREAMLCCIEHGGHAVGVLSDSLARQAVSSRFRDALVGRNLVLTSPFEPEAQFHVAKAMARNKLIYGLADFALVVSSGYRKGGTWAGARENLHRKWVPLFVRNDKDIPAGNRELLDAGAIPMEASSIGHSAIAEWMRHKAASHDSAAGNVPKSESGQGTLAFS